MLCDVLIPLGMVAFFAWLLWIQRDVPPGERKSPLAVFGRDKP
jgi:hypothetical protein